MRRRLARLLTVAGISIGLVAVVPALTSSAFAADCSSGSIAVDVSCVNVLGVATITSAPTEPSTSGCVQQDCVTVTRSGPSVHKRPTVRPPQGQPGGHNTTTPPASKPRGEVLGFHLQRLEREASDFYAGSFDSTLPLESEGWVNGIYRNPLPQVVEAPAPSTSLWSGITAPAAFTSIVVGMLLLVSAFSFKRLMLN